MTPRPPTSRPRSTLAAVVLAVPLLAGCQALGINEQYDALYPDLPTAGDSWDAAHIPMLVPADARSIRVGYNTVEEGHVLAFTSAGGLTADYCEEGPVEGAPAFEPGWWPAGDLDREGWRCGDWNVVADGPDGYLVWGD